MVKVMMEMVHGTEMAVFFQVVMEVFGQVMGVSSDTAVENDHVVDGGRGCGSG